jgi:tRNA-splicing ligase RtcB (3'-phosphate/5'-hydroxy nucleic acid ligase)
MTTVKGVQQVTETVWEIPPSYKKGMRVPAGIYATEKLMRDMDEAVYEQVTNVAMLSGITKYAMCMPDGHSGYGFPIGGVATMDIEEGGVISPGGIGFDINCGMRLVTTNLIWEELQPPPPTGGGSAVRARACRRRRRWIREALPPGVSQGGGTGSPLVRG